MNNIKQPRLLYDHNVEKSSCGVGFITKKDSKQTHDLIIKANEALCSVPHRGGMSSEGIGDGAGISIDLSVNFFSKITNKTLKFGDFVVGNFFMPKNKVYKIKANNLIINTLENSGFKLIKSRDVPVNKSVLNKFSQSSQLTIKQFIFSMQNTSDKNIDKSIYRCLLDIEAVAFRDKNLEELYPLSLSRKLQVLKGRLKSNEIIPYFKDLNDTSHKIFSLYFHTRFSTNTEPHPFMAQPFRLIAHNGELNTNKKNILSENASYKSKNKDIIRPRGQSDSCRLDQTLQNRIFEDELDIVSAVISMMPPAWENDKSLSEDIISMFEYFSLFEEKNDGPAAVIFGDGNIIGARLDRLGLRPLRTIETVEYLSAMSEAGQINFPEEDIISRGRIEAGGILYYNHQEQKTYNTEDALKLLSSKTNYKKLLHECSIKLHQIEQFNGSKNSIENIDNLSAKYVAYHHNQETFRFFLDPMLETGAEKVSAMGYGNAINALSDQEGGMAKYFSQKFAQVTNPPLDSIREADGMTLRVSLGCKTKNLNKKSPQIIIDTPILKLEDLNKIKNQNYTPTKNFEILYEPDHKNAQNNERILKDQIEKICFDICEFASSSGGIIIISDANIDAKKAVIPLILIVSAINQSLINEGLRFNVSIIVESGQICSSHHIACTLGFGAAAIYPLCVEMRIKEKHSQNKILAYNKFIKASEKSLMKIMGKVGLCTVESYSGGEFFEPNYLDTTDPSLKKYFPNMFSPVGGVRFKTIAQSSLDWHLRSKIVNNEKDIPILGLFKERSEGAGHSYGITAVREFVDLTEEKISFKKLSNSEDIKRLSFFTINQMEDAYGISDAGYKNTSFDSLSDKQIDKFKITPGYLNFIKLVGKERFVRPAALRDVLDFPINFENTIDTHDFTGELLKLDYVGNNNFLIKGLIVNKVLRNIYCVTFSNKENINIKIKNFSISLQKVFKENVSEMLIKNQHLQFRAKSKADNFFSNFKTAPNSIELGQVQPASEITKTFASGAMSHGALVSNAHEAVAHGTNMVGALSNSGEGGEHMSRYGTIRASKIKQFASGRFGVWAGYLADPMLEQVEIKIGQGAKPGEGGQLPASKVSVEIAAARGGVPGVELVSPPPHHDTYSIEDLAQLIHDAKAARVKVIVKLVSSDGIGTIAVGVAKAGADVINIAGGTGGTGAAAVTSLKYTGRSAEIGLAEVNQALCINKIRQKVILRCSGAHQTGTDVVKSAILGADSFEFGTSAMMMLKCVMAKNCNIKCPAGLTTNSELFDGDPRALAQYFLNIAHEIREILANIGFKSLKDVRGRTDLLHLVNHKSSVGQLNLKMMLKQVENLEILKPIYLEKNYDHDQNLYNWFLEKFNSSKDDAMSAKKITLNNRNKTFGGQLSIDIERYLNYETKIGKIGQSRIFTLPSGRKSLKPKLLFINTDGSAGQSYAAFCNDGMVFKHIGTCNDGVGKSCSGGEIIIKSPISNKKNITQNVLIGNFALFGATGGKLFVEGQAGDRFAVRNSGATAVIEGVGDYCGEYMTNGTILNLGSFSRGYGNGMSGGFLYQYDPYKKLSNFISTESVFIGELSENTEISKIHAHTIHNLLKWHFDASGSKKAKYILDNWSIEKNNFSFVTPKSLLQYQDYEEILKSKTRKELLEELSSYLVKYQIQKLKKIWKDGKHVLDGHVPNADETDKRKTHELLNNWKIYETAKTLIVPGDSKTIRDLILTEDFNLISKLLKFSKDAISKYNDEELSVLISNKRIDDYKSALRLRNVISIDSPSTYGWLIYQQNKNRKIIYNMPSYEELFFEQSLHSFV